MPDLDRRRQILEDVAAGTLTPEEAAVLLAAAEVGEGGGPDPAPAAEPTPAPAPDDIGGGQEFGADDASVTTIRVRGNCRAVTIVGDPDVHTAVAEGEHTARLEGDTLTIESLLDRSHGFAFIRGPGVRVRSRVRMGAQTVPPLTIRMNPALALESQVDAGSMTIRGVRGPIRAQTSAGAVRIDGFESPIELKVAAGSATAHGRMDTGTSRIECDAGKVSVRLTPDSSVKVRGRVNLGQLTAPDSIGGGAAVLDIVANLGAVEVAVDSGDDAEAGDDSPHHGFGGFGSFGSGFGGFGSGRGPRSGGAFGTHP